MFYGKVYYTIWLWVSWWGAWARKINVNRILLGISPEPALAILRMAVKSCRSRGFYRDGWHARPRDGCWLVAFFMRLINCGHVDVFCAVNAAILGMTTPNVPLWRNVKWDKFLNHDKPWHRNCVTVGYLQGSLASAVTISLQAIPQRIKTGTHVDHGGL